MMRFFISKIIKIVNQLFYNFDEGVISQIAGLFLK